MNKKFFFIFCLFLGLFYTAAFPKYHPGIKWKEISDKRFVVVFPKGYEETAVYTLSAAGEMYGKLMRLWGEHIQIRGPIRILLTDVYDYANGSATYFPYNHIEIYLFNPPPDSTLGSYREWIHLALSHELTHIINFNSGSGFTYFMRKVLGSHPAFYPIMFMPVWGMEGMAIYGESYVNPWGRLNTPDYHIMLRYIAGAGKMPDWGDFWGDPTSWPGGTAKYLYGAAFFNFLGKKYGCDKLPEFVGKFTHSPLPLTIHHRFKQVFKKDITDLWNEFLRHLEQADSGPTFDRDNSKVKFLTGAGKFKKYPLVVDKDQAVFVNENYTEFPGIYRLNLNTGEKRRLIKKSGITGLSYSAGEKKIYFSAADYYKSFYYCSDIYVLDPVKNNVRQLTEGKRLSYPVKPGASGNEIYCVKRVKTKSFLCLLDLNTGKESILPVLKPGGFDSLAFPAVSPDNRYIAASIKERDKNWSIALFDLKGNLIRRITGGQFKCYYPLWKNAHEIYFVSEHKKNYRLALFNLGDDSFYIYNDHRVPAIKSFGLLPGKEEAIGSFFDANGYNLGLINLSQLHRERFRIDAETPVPPVTPVPSPAGMTGSKGYDFTRELFPKYIDFNYRMGGSECQPGVILTGRDLTAQHSYTVGGFYGFKSNTANFTFSYTYDGLYPSLRFRYSDLSDYNESSHNYRYIHNERKFRVAGSFPLSIRDRRQFYFYSDIHFERAADDFLDLSDDYRVNLNGTTLAFLFNSAREYYDSFSYADGMNVSLSYSREFKFMGSDYDINTVSLDYRQYISLLRPNVLALRLAVSDSWGEAGRLFHMGGAESQEGFQPGDNHLFELMRGYPSGYFTGTGGYLLNLEYRLSLLKIENVFLMARSIERLYLSLFADIGNLWIEEKKMDPSYSLGMELNLVTYLGDIEFNFSGGIAVGQRPYHSPIVYLRIGSSF